MIANRRRMQESSQGFNLYYDSQRLLSQSSEFFRQDLIQNSLEYASQQSNPCFESREMEDKNADWDGTQDPPI